LTEAHRRPERATAELMRDHRWSRGHADDRVDPQRSMWLLAIVGFDGNRPTRLVSSREWISGEQPDQCARGARMNPDSRSVGVGGFPASSMRSMRAFRDGWSGGSNSICSTAEHAWHVVVTNRPSTPMSISTFWHSRHRLTPYDIGIGVTVCAT